MFTTKKTLLKRIAAGMLAAIMVMALLPGTSVTQVNADTTDALDNLVLRKWAQLEDDGTYTIQLEAYAKGEVKTTVKKETVPADIVLVLDQSGSMTQTKNNMSGIPSDTYTKVNSTPTNQQAKEGSYYYKVGNTYYPLEVEKKIVKTETKWIGQDGKEYTEDQLSYAWTSSNGEVYTTEKPFVSETLQTYTRTHEWSVATNRFWYVNDNDSGDKSDSATWSGAFSSDSSQNLFKEKYESDSTTVEFGTKGATSDDPRDTANDPYYVAAVYTTVTKQENITYEYIYSYTDDAGTEHILNENNKSSDDTAACPVSPLYTRGTKTGTRLEALQYAANDFIKKVQKNAKKNNLDHRIAVVGFASGSSGRDGDGSETNYLNTELFIGKTQYNYHRDGKGSTSGVGVASSQYSNAFQRVSDTTQYGNLQNSIQSLAGSGATWPVYGFEMANGIFEKNSAAYTKADGTTGTRSRMIVFLTDGVPGNSGYLSTAASRAVTEAETSKTTYKATVHTIAVFDENDTPTTDGNVDTFLKNTSSSGTYTLATKGSDLTDFFGSVTSNIESPESAVTLSADAVLKDYVSEYFEIPDGFTVEDNVTIQTANALVGENAFGTPQAAPSGVTAELITGTDGKTIEGVQVSGFDYLSSENMVTVTGTGDNAKASGKKLIVTLKGLLAKDSAATGTLIDTNTTDSAIWDKDADGQEAKVKEFPVPHTRLAKKAFVLDYAKEAALDVYDAAKVDDDEDLLFSYVGKDSTVLKQKYGTAAVKDGTGLTYTPSTMQWDGYDTFYALGKDTVLGDARTQNIWSKVSVIPANNVYYEDDFVTDNASGTVGIVYAGDWKVTTTNDPDDWKDALEAGSGAGANTETPNTEIHGGWQNADLADDTTFTDGSAHVSSTKGATATFTFTGKGVDVYSYTDLNSGVVRARLYKGTETKDALMTKSYIIDNYADSGEYYQIPTVGFLLEEYGTYTVELMVFPKGNTDGARSTYYLDGVRIYNPLNGEDETVTDAYGDEADAVFQSIREILLDAESLEAGTTDTTDGVVFIDQIKDADGTTTGEHTTSVIGTYEDLGPKNEVYLASGQAIAFAVNPAGTYSVGLKAMTGQTAKASVSSVTETGEDARKEYEVKHSSDLYYEVVPNEDGLILIRNTGDNLLSITKLKMCGEAYVETPDTVMLLAYADTFDTLEVADTEKEPADENVPGTDSKDDPAEQEKPVQTISQFIKQIFESLRGWFRH